MSSAYTVELGNLGSGRVISEQPRHNYSSDVQPAGSGRDWHEQICDCTKSTEAMINTMLCYCCRASHVAFSLGEYCCLQLVLSGGAYMAMRTKVRMLLGIKGSLCGDAVCAACCPCCTLQQMYQELQHAGKLEENKKCYVSINPECYIC